MTGAAARHRASERTWDGCRIGSPIRAAWRLAAYAGWTLLLLPLYLPVFGLAPRLAERFAASYHRGCLGLLGVTIERDGAPQAARPTLFVANHCSYIDIPVLGALIAGSFIAKSDVRDWPVYGWLGRLQRTVFIDRRTRSAAQHRESLRHRLAAGDNLILFPEGTSSDGNRTLAFKSALFGVVEAKDGVGEPGTAPVTVQPVSLAYVALDGIPLGRWLRPCIAWYGDMALVPHLWRMAGLGALAVRVRFHPPVDPAAFPTRKALSDHCRRAVAEGLAAAPRDRRIEWPGPPPPAAD